MHAVTVCLIVVRRFLSKIVEDPSEETAPLCHFIGTVAAGPPRR
jgi:hypothetical protein